MAPQILKVFLVLVLLSFPTSGQNSQQHLICKNVENVFSDDHDDSTASHGKRIVGSPGKQGPTGVKGERGVPGIKGQPGNPAIVDYDQIFEKIENKTRQGLEKMNLQFAELQRNATDLKAGLEEVNSKLEILQSNFTDWIEPKRQRCKEENGFPYDGKCYFIGHLSSGTDINFDQAVQNCSSRNSLIAELHSLAHQKNIQDFFRSRIPSSRTYIYFWIGTTYQRSEGKLRFRSGKKVSVGQFKWYSSYPSGSQDKTGIYIENDVSSDQGIFNYPATYVCYGVICEKPL